MKHFHFEPISVQLYQILMDHGFSISEAVDLASKWTKTYTSTSQRIFKFGSVKVEIMACEAKLIFAPSNHETPARTLERIQAQQNLELDRRARKIRERRQADERRRPW